MRSRVVVWFAVLLPVLALTLLSINFLDAIARDGRNLPFLDWFVHTNAVSRVLSGAPLFDPIQLAGPYSLPQLMPFGWAYPPISIVPLAPFTGTMVGLSGWLILNLGLFISGIWAALRRDLGNRVGLPFALTLTGLLIFPLPFLSGVISANANVAIAGIYAWCWAIGRSEGRIGIVAALAAVIKIYPGALVLWPTGAARRRSIAMAAAVVIGLTVVSLPIVGLQSWLDFPIALGNAQLSCGETRYSVACLLLPLLGTTGAKAAGVLLGGAFLLGALWTRRDRLAFVLFGASMLAPVPDMHLHYWLIAYVALVVVAGGLYARWLSRARPHVA